MKFHIVDQIWQFWQKFTTSIIFSKFWTNFTVLTKFQLQGNTCNAWNADNADNADNSDNVDKADFVDNADNVDNADYADNADIAEIADIADNKSGLWIKPFFE